MIEPDFEVVELFSGRIMAWAPAEIVDALDYEQLDEMLCEQYGLKTCGSWNKEPWTYRYYVRCEWA